jgi:hypothetical protein
MRNLTDLLGPSCDLLFVETVLLKVWFHSRNERVEIKNLRRQGILIHAGFHGGRN